MAEKSRKPKIRFTGCTEDWEQRKLGEIAEQTFGGGTPSTSNVNFWSGNVPWIQSSDLTEGNLFDVEPKKYISDSAIKFSATKIIPQNSIAIVVRVGVGKLALLPFSYSTSQDFLSISKLSVNEIFATYSIYKKMQEDLSLIQGTSIKGITKEELLVKKLLIPSNESEQIKLGTFFRHLDHLTILHQRKRERFVNIKKVMLEKMFPKKGADVPEVRFAGFTEAWEQRKVGEYYDFKNGLNKGKEYFGLGTPIVNFTDVFHLRGIYEKDLKGKVNLTKPEIANFQVRVGDIFFTRTSETIDEIGFPSVMLDDPEDTVFSGFVLRGRALQDDPLTLQFKRYVFFTNAFRKEMIKKSSMTTRALTSGTAIKNMVFIFPKNKEEQEIIGTFFRHLDHLITLHQRKVNLLHNIKKACLETMFV